MGGREIIPDSFNVKISVVVADICEIFAIFILARSPISEIQIFCGVGKLSL
jgi:hypothetical protein